MIWIAGFFGLIVFSAFWAIRSPGIALGLVICMFGLEPLLQSQNVFFIDNQSYINMAIGFVVLVGATGSIFRKPLQSAQFGIVHLLALSLYGMGFLSFLWTLSPEEFHRWKSAIPYFGIYLVFGPIIAREERSLQQAFGWALIIGIPVALMSAFYADWGVRGMILAKPVLENNRLVFETLPLSLASMASSLGVIGLVCHLRIPGKLLFRLSVLALGIYIAFLTESRGQVVAIIGVTVIVYPISNRATSIKGLFVTVIGLALFGIIVYYIVQNLELVRWRKELLESAVVGRREMWSFMINKWLASGSYPLIIGFGACSSFDIIGFYPHNLIVEILTEFGIIGFGIFCAILLKSFINCLNLLAKLEEFPAMRSDVVTIIGLIGVNIALSMKEGSLYGWPSLFFYMICLEQRVAITGTSILRFRLFRAAYIKSIPPNTANRFYRSSGGRPW